LIPYLSFSRKESVSVMKIELLVTVPAEIFRNEKLFPGREISE
jgi:hypothetical protein